MKFRIFGDAMKYIELTMNYFPIKELWVNRRLNGYPVAIVDVVSDNRNKIIKLCFPSISMCSLVSDSNRID